jgi:hypothetical protein
VRACATRLPRYAVLAAITAAFLAGGLSGCGPAVPSSSGEPTAPGKSAAPLTPLNTVRLAAQTASGVTSFTGTMSLQTSADPAASGSASSLGNVTMNATFAEQLHPSLRGEVDIASLSSAGMSLSGGVQEIVTPATIYLRWAFLTQTLHLTRPWLSIPVSAMSKSSGVNFGQLFAEVSSSGPLSEAQLLGGATAVRKTGTSVIGGVPVTEYTGTLPMSKGLQYLTGSARTQLAQAVAADGFTTADFIVWIDTGHTVRKAIVTEVGKTVTETITTTITSVDKPFTVTLPAASETAPLPGSDLG